MSANHTPQNETTLFLTLNDNENAKKIILTISAKPLSTATTSTSTAAALEELTSRVSTLTLENAALRAKVDELQRCRVADRLAMEGLVTRLEVLTALHARSLSNVVTTTATTTTTTPIIPPAVFKPTVVPTVAPTTSIAMPVFSFEAKNHFPISSTANSTVPQQWETLYCPTSIPDQNVTFNYTSITMMPEYSNQSFEELRWNYYQRSIGSNPANPVMATNQAASRPFQYESGRSNAFSVEKLVTHSNAIANNTPVERTTTTTEAPSTTSSIELGTNVPATATATSDLPPINDEHPTTASAVSASTTDWHFNNPFFV